MIKIKPKYILSLFCLFSLQISSAQNSFAVHFSEDNGFVSNEVFHVFQDHDNYIWFSTNNGLFRFDGHKMDVFSTTKGLASNVIFEVFEDKNKKLWAISLHNQIAYFKEESGFFTDSSLAMYQDLHYNYHLIPLKGSCFIDDFGNKFISYYLKGIFVNSPYFGRFPLPKKDKNAFYIYHWGDKAMISSTFVKFFNGKIHLIDLRKQKELIIDINKECSFDENLFYKIGVQKKKEKIYFFFYNKIFCINSLSGDYTVHQMDNIVLWLQFDRDECLWAGLYNAGARAFPKGNLNKKPSCFLENEAITSVCKDNQNGLWFSTMTNGVFYLPSSDIIQFSKTTQEEELQ
jgi:ligand-binding sensor domain-containing protein